MFPLAGHSRALHPKDDSPPLVRVLVTILTQVRKRRCEEGMLRRGADPSELFEAARHRGPRQAVRSGGSLTFPSRAKGRRVWSQASATLGDH